MAEYQTLKLERQSGVSTLTMNRPDKFNAMNLVMRRELAEAFTEIGADQQTRVVVLTGAGTAFSAGGDINDFDSQTPEQLHHMMGRISHRWLRAFWALPQPVIAAVNGPAAGGGCNLALCCDLVYASDRSYFAQTFLEIGLAPDLSGAFILPRLVGLARAKEMALLGGRTSAADAAALGLVNAVFSGETLMAQVQERATRIAARSGAATSLTKRMFNRSFESSMESLMDDEHYIQSFLFHTEDSRSGIKRFLEARRKPAPPAAK